MRKLKFEECPKTRAEFVRKYKEDNVFRAKAKCSGFQVIFDNVIFPNGKVASANVKQLALVNNGKRLSFNGGIQAVAP